MSEAKQKPILFTDAMVRAILEGRKTQTRRLVKHQPTPDMTEIRVEYRQENEASLTYRAYPGRGTARHGIDACQYGVPGDLLWVREGVIKIGTERTGKNGQYLWPKFASDEKAKRWFESECAYTADLKASDPLYLGTYGTLNKMFMPRWASRITLEIKSVRAERVQGITEEDALAEGCEAMTCPPQIHVVTDDGGSSTISPDYIHGVPKIGDKWGASTVAFVRPIAAKTFVTAKEKYCGLWTSINGPESWAANPFCWVIEFARVGGAA